MPVSTTLRRLLVLAVLAALGAMAATRWRTKTTPVPAEPPTWPPLRPGATTAAADGATATPAAAAGASPAAAGAADVAWVAPLADGSCPPGYPVKAKESSGIYHLPEGRFYERTNADRCYSNPAAAEADGYRRSKS